MMRSLFVAATICVPLISLAAPAAKKKAAEPKPKAEAKAAEPAIDPADVIDISKVERRLVFSDGKGHFIVAPKVRKGDFPISLTQLRHKTLTFPGRRLTKGLQVWGNLGL